MVLGFLDLNFIYYRKVKFGKLDWLKLIYTDIIYKLMYTESKSLSSWVLSVSNDQIRVKHLSLLSPGL